MNGGIAACWALVICSGVTLAQEPSAPAPSELVAALERSVADAVAKAEVSVVAIARVRNDAGPADAEQFDLRPGGFPLPRFGDTEPEALRPDFLPNEYGTGVVVEPPAGKTGAYILTANHVLGDVSKNDYYVWSRKRPFKATVLATNPTLDLAMLKIEAVGLKPISLGDAKNLKKGQFVVSLGNPYSIARDGEASSAFGTIANTNRAAPEQVERSSGRVRPETIYHYGNLLQTDIHLRRGTSGGALVNLQGELVGLTTQLVPRLEVAEAGGFAMPVDQAFRHALEKLKAGERAEYGFLGVSPKPLSLDQRQRGKHGALVHQVVVNTPAAEIGLAEDYAQGREYDVITHVDDHQVTDADDLFLQLAKMPAGAKVRLTVERTNRESPDRPRVLQKEVTLAKKYMESRRPAFSTVVDPAWRGLTIDHATAIPNFAERASYIDRAGCVAVLDVTRNSPTWKAGLRPGMFITHVGDKRVNTPRAFHDATNSQAGAVDLRLTEEIGPRRTVRVAP
jgi:S1-C subfamily serine protease